MKDTVIYIHGKNGSADEADIYKPLFSGYEVTGLDYRAETPRQAAEEFPALFDTACADSGKVLLIANSIGAYLAMHALADRCIARAFFISPIVDMERLILDMMAKSGVSEKELSKCGEMTTIFGESLSWDYLCYVREHPVDWHIPTEIICGENDMLTSIDTMTAFAEKIGAGLTVMPCGEHWFHTDEQMKFLRGWLTQFSAE